jgi:hypothetical protein
LVSEWITTSAPNEIGFVRYGVENVASTISGTPTACASSATALRSTISRAGLEHVSQKKARVLSSAAAAKALGSVASTKRTSMPNLGRMSLNIVYVPPYRAFAEMTLSPSLATLMIE